MSDLEWDHLVNLFEQMVALTPEQQQQFLYSQSDYIRQQLGRQLNLMLRATSDSLPELDHPGAIQLFASRIVQQHRATEETLDAVPHDDEITTDSELPVPVEIVGFRVREFGDYKLLDEIARGGMGVVYKARQISLNRIVALKMILAGELADETSIRRFQSEAQTAAQLDHPGIVAIYEVGECEGNQYFSMAYVDGETLAAKIKNGPLPPVVATEYVRQIAESVAYAHQQGVIHRDLKPSNVLIDKRDKARVTDFGLARLVIADSSLTATGQILGTPSFMPPEQASGSVEEIDERSDVYSIGATLYALLSGRPPFQSDNPVDTMLEVLERKPVPLRGLNSKVSRDLEIVCMACLEKLPSDRIATAHALAEDLKRVLRREPIRARPIGLSTRIWRWTWRHRRMFGVSVFSFACSVALTLLAILGIRTLNERHMRSVHFPMTSEEANIRILDHKTGEVVDSFSTPTADPIVLPIGEYQMLVSTGGALPRDYLLKVERETNTTLIGNGHRLGSQRVTLESLKHDYIGPAINSSTFLPIAVDDGMDLLVKDRFTRRSPNRAPQPLAPESNWYVSSGGIRRVDWESGSTVWTAINQFTDSRIGGEYHSLDLDEDGYDEVFLRLDHAVVCLSGMDGHVVWSFEFPRSGEAGLYLNLVDKIIVSDSNFGRVRIASLQARDGKRIWLKRFDDVEHNGVLHAQVLNKSCVAVISTDHVACVDFATGQTIARHEIDLSGYNQPSVLVTDFDSDGTSELVLNEHRQQTLRCVSIESGKDIWRRRGIELPEVIEYGEKNGILVFVSREHVLEAVELKTGNTLWQTPLRDDGLSFVPSQVGPDINDDGWCDIFIVKDEYLVAISGATGEFIWSERIKLGGIKDYFLWDGALGIPPILAINVANGIKYIYAHTGEEINGTAVGAHALRVLDVNQDRISDLLIRDSRDRLRVVRGKPPCKWRSVNSQSIIDDIDGDNILDLTWDRTHVLSGKDGRIIKADTERTTDWKKQVFENWPAFVPRELVDKILGGPQMLDRAIGSKSKSIYVS